MLYNFPFKIDGRGHSAEVDMDRHIQQLVQQVLFTTLGERVNRPTFGTRIDQLVFGLNSEELATSTQFLIQGTLQQWLGEIIQVVAVRTRSEDSKLYIDVQYLIRQNQQTHVVQFIKEV